MKQELTTDKIKAIRTTLARRDAAREEIERPAMLQRDGSRYPGHVDGLQKAIRAQTSYLESCALAWGWDVADLEAAVRSFVEKGDAAWGAA